MGKAREANLAQEGGGTGLGNLTSSPTGLTRAAWICAHTITGTDH